jgi:hypothetical protein
MTAKKQMPHHANVFVIYPYMLIVYFVPRPISMAPEHLWPFEVK